MFVPKATRAFSTSRGIVLTLGTKTDVSTAVRVVPILQIPKLLLVQKTVSAPTSPLVPIKSPISAPCPSVYTVLKTVTTYTLQLVQVVPRLQKRPPWQSAPDLRESGTEQV